jgi:hypothetical protein
MPTARLNRSDHLLSTRRKNNSQGTGAGNREAVTLVNDQLVGMRNDLGGRESIAKGSHQRGGSAGGERRLLKGHLVVLRVLDVVIDAHPRDAQEGDDGGEETDANEGLNDHAYLVFMKQFNCNARAFECQSVGPDDCRAAAGVDNARDISQKGAS